MTIHFGIAFDDIVFSIEKNTIDTYYLGEKGFLQLLETWLGLAGDVEDNEYLRVERFRQALLTHSKSNDNTFYKKSFEADAFSTANFLLQRRDELSLANWDFSVKSNTPKRLLILAELEYILTEMGGIARGFADRFLAVENACENSKIIADLEAQIVLHDPFELFPFYWQRLLHNFNFATISYAENEMEATDLDVFKQKLSTNPTLHTTAKCDGSLLIIKGKRETDLAVWLAKILSQTPDFQPLNLIPEANQLLDSAVQQEGLSRMGIASAAARPVQQLLKLVNVFLWQPIDPFRIMEFLSLAIKPLDDRLAKRLAAVMASRPGMLSASWFIALSKYEAELQEKKEAGENIDIQAIMKQYRFWFDRPRYDANERVPKRDAIEIYEYLENWAYKTFSDSSKQMSLLTLSEQARKIKELLVELPETMLTRLELDRIVRTIYRPSPVTIYEREVGATPYIHQSGAMAAKTEDLVFWNFTDHSPQQILNVWKKEELAYFSDNQVFIEPNAKKNELYLAHQKRPIMFTHQRLLLIVPALTNGSETLEHPLMGYLHSAIQDHKNITIDIDEEGGKTLADWFFPKKENVTQRELSRPQPFIFAQNIYRKIRKSESPTSLEDLIYYPHKWALRYQAGLYASSILSIAKDQRLMGNLAHRCFEEIFKNKTSEWTKKDVENWTKDNVQKLLRQEGAVLLMYGKEQERERFLNTLQYAAWSLISMINNNGWSFIGSEMRLSGKFENMDVTGIADLILQRGEEMAIVDLKWSGATYRGDLIRNQEDLQLVMYSQLLNTDWSHTSYFIIETGQMLARNLVPFKEAKLVTKQEESHKEIGAQIFDRMMRTIDWRLEQLQEGKIEVRTETTLKSLEDTYSGIMMDLLEMKKNDSKFDDYRVLINAVE
jgi:ATP-dependent helicase/nuclease subunit B